MNRFAEFLLMLFTTMSYITGTAIMYYNNKILFWYLICGGIIFGLIALDMFKNGD